MECRRMLADERRFFSGTISGVDSNHRRQFPNWNDELRGVMDVLSCRALHLRRALTHSSGFFRWCRLQGTASCHGVGRRQICTGHPEWGFSASPRVKIHWPMQHSKPHHNSTGPAQSSTQQYSPEGHLMPDSEPKVVEPALGVL